MYKRGEIVLIPVPFSDLSASKRRPVLVISKDQKIVVKPIGVISNAIQNSVVQDINRLIS